MKSYGTCLSLTGLFHLAQLSKEASLKLPSKVVGAPSYNLLRESALIPIWPLLAEAGVEPGLLWCLAGVEQLLSVSSVLLHCSCPGPVAKEHFRLTLWAPICVSGFPVSPVLNLGCMSPRWELTMCSSSGLPSSLYVSESYVYFT